MLGDKQTHAGNGYAGEREKAQAESMTEAKKKVVDGQGLGALTARLGRCRFGERRRLCLCWCVACACACCLWASLSSGASGVMWWWCEWPAPELFLAGSQQMEWLERGGKAERDD